MDFCSNFLFFSHAALHQMSASDKERIALEKAWLDKDEVVLGKENVEGLANRASIEAEQCNKNCEAMDLEIARLWLKMLPG